MRLMAVCSASLNVEASVSVLNATAGITDLPSEVFQEVPVTFSPLKFRNSTFDAPGLL